MTSIFIPSLVKLHAARDERQTRLCHEITRMKKMVYMQHTSQPPKTSINEKSMYRSSTATSSSYSSLPRFLYADYSPLPATTSPYRAYIKLNRRTNQDRPRMNTRDQYNTRQHNSNRTHNNTIIQHNTTQPNT